MEVKLNENPRYMQKKYKKNIKKEWKDELAEIVYDLRDSACSVDWKNRKISLETQKQKDLYEILYEWTKKIVSKTLWFPDVYSWKISVKKNDLRHILTLSIINYSFFLYNKEKWAYSTWVNTYSRGLQLRMKTSYDKHKKYIVEDFDIQADWYNETTLNEILIDNASFSSYTWFVEWLDLPLDYALLFKNAIDEFWTPEFNVTEIMIFDLMFIQWYSWNKAMKSILVPKDSFSIHKKNLLEKMKKYIDLI